VRCFFLPMRSCLGKDLVSELFFVLVENSQRFRLRFMSMGVFYMYGKILLEYSPRNVPADATSPEPERFLGEEMTCT
jgi:hypothetical protein